MEKITKKYVNKLILGRDWEQTEVEFENPELIDTKDITSFYFSEQSFVIDGEEIYTGKSKRISPTFHIGTRISMIEALEMAKSSPENLLHLQRLYEKNPNGSLCKSDMGYLFLMEDDAITLKEYISNRKKI